MFVISSNILLPNGGFTQVLFVAVLQTVPSSSIPDGWMGLDIGPDSIKTFSEALDTSKTIIWNGPMGVFEMEKFAAGTDVCFSSLSQVYCLHLCHSHLLPFRGLCTS